MSNITKVMAISLIAVLMCQQFGASANLADNRSVVREQLAKIPVGKTIEVKLLGEDGGKIKGKFVSIADEFFEMQIAKSGKASTEKIAYDRVGSVKKSGMSLWIKVGIVWGAVLIALAAAGLLGES